MNALARRAAYRVVTEYGNPECDRANADLIRSEELARERGEAWAGGLGSREIVGVARCVVYIASPSILAFDLAGTRGIAYAPTGHFWIRTEKKERLALRNAFERVRVSLSDVAEGRFAVCPW